MQINSLKSDRGANPIVTIITVVYNADNSIERTIQNIIGQTYSNIEYIIIDGGSTDSTVDIIKSYEDNISYWVSEPDNGIYFAMNKAIDIAVGTWVNFMNAGDTFIDNNVIKNLVNQTSDDADIYYGSRYIYTGDNAVFEECLHLDDIYYKMPFGHQAAFIKSAILKKLRFDTSYKLSADYDFFIRCYRENCKFHDLGFPVCNFHTGGLSYQQHLKSTIETLKILSDYTDEEGIKKSLFYKNFTKKVMQENNNIDIQLQEKEKELQNIYASKKWKFATTLASIISLGK